MIGNPVGSVSGEDFLYPSDCPEKGSIQLGSVYEGELINTWERHVVDRYMKL